MTITSEDIQDMLDRETVLKERFDTESAAIEAFTNTKEELETLQNELRQAVAIFAEQDN
jgi:peptidoglycan hydrolase CwlO-like protein